VFSREVIICAEAGVFFARLLARTASQDSAKSFSRIPRGLNDPGWDASPQNRQGPNLDCEECKEHFENGGAAHIVVSHLLLG
jgi:hypothetical protein